MKADCSPTISMAIFHGYIRVPEGKGYKPYPFLTYIAIENDHLVRELFHETKNVIFHTYIQVPEDI